MNQSISRDIVIKLVPQYENCDFDKLVVVWDEIVLSILTRMVELVRPHINEIHIDLFPEISFVGANLIHSIAEKVVEDRIKGRSFSEIRANSELRYFSSEDGKEGTENTARSLAEAWLKRYNERWKPKTDALIENERNPKRTKLAIKKVDRPHFIPRSFIKRYWAKNGMIRRYVKKGVGKFKSKKMPFSKWGHSKNLYTEEMEAYFGLIEGDAVRPIDMLLRVVPLNRPQKEALVGFIVIQRLRNPYVMAQSEELMKPLVKNMIGEEQANNPEYMRSVYETLYRNNDFYDSIARPIINNVWVVVRSKKPHFVLPDTCNILGIHDGSTYVIMPFTPKDCLVVLPLAQTEERIIPHYMEAGEELASDLGQVLILAAKEEFLSDCSVEIQEVIESQSDELIRRVITLVSRGIAEK